MAQISLISVQEHNLHTPEAKQRMNEPPKLLFKRQHKELEDIDADNGERRTIRRKTTLSEKGCPVPKCDGGPNHQGATGCAIPCYTAEDFEREVGLRLDEAIKVYDMEQAHKRRDERIKDAILVRNKIQESLEEVRKQDLVTMRNAVQSRLKICRKDAMCVMRENLIHNLKHYVKTLEAANDLMDMKTMTRSQFL
jgi:hypothetical protein